MERHKKEKRHRKKVPRVPIKTYKWEDIRRARLRGGYPWTYLYKEPFDEQVDSKLFRMEAKPKVTSATLKVPNPLDIKEITNGAEDNQDTLTPEPSGYIVITEVPSDSENHSKDTPTAGGSVTIEDVGETETVNLESAESSDNISQYLDKEEPTGPAETSNVQKEEEVKTENGREKRAQSEEPKRKRKLSIDSSYSRKSLSKLAIMKRLKEAKDKIKVPKLNLPSLPNLTALSNPLKQDTSKSKKEKEPATKPIKTKEIASHFQPDPNAKPVYIHIPLKPPEGKFDEFSYLEHEEKKPEALVAPQPSETPEIQEEKKIPKLFDDAPKIEISEALDDRRMSGDPDDIVAFEILKSETIDLDHAAKNGLQGGSDYLIIEQQDDEKSETRSMIIIMPGPEEPSLSRAGSKRGTPSRQGSKKVRAKSAEPERKRKLSSGSSHSRKSLSKLTFLKKFKDAKDKFKLPKFSLSRSESKKTPSKKEKEEVNTPTETKVETKKKETSGNEPKYIHIPLKPPPGQTDEFSHLEFEEKKEASIPPQTEAVKEQSSVESPESPKAEGVQFIFLTPPSDDEILDHPDVPETPSSESTNFFTTHELKEIAKDAVDKASPKSKKKLQSVQEEDSSETKSETDDTKEKETEIKQEEKPKETEEKQKGAEDEKPKEAEKEKPKEIGKGKAKKTKSKKGDAAKPKAEPEKPKTELEKPKPEKMVVDEEDGLKLTESAMAKQEQNIKAKEVTEEQPELKSNLKSDGSPVLKKKVSFKRKSKDDSKDGDYEDIQAPTDDKSASKDQATDEHKSKLEVMGTSQSMSVDEEKSYLDEQKIIKTTSLEEDYNRWSKLSDHDYEPVNPPPDNVSPVTTAPPTVHVIDTDRGLQPKTTTLTSSPSLERPVETETSPEESLTAQEMQTEIENKFFSKTVETPSKPSPTVHTITTVTTSTTESHTPKPEGPGRFQQAIKNQTDKFRTKLHEMKKPNIKLPSKPNIKMPSKPNIKLPSKPTFKKPNLQKFKFEKPKINLPKLPDTAKINLPTFTLPRKSPQKRSLNQRHLSTESNAGGSKKNYFDFRTYPRFFKKKPKDDLDSFSSKSEREVPEFATVPRTKRNKVEDDRWGGRDTIRIPLHAEDSIEDNEREDSVERRMASHMRYEQDIDIDDAYERENQEIHAASPFSHAFNSRWNHGSFHPHEDFPDENRNQQITDLDSPVEKTAPHESFDTNTSKDIHSSESSLGMHRRGVLEEIDSDEFFLRQKGISQDNIEVGMYLSSEIREAFKSPTNALADLQREPDFSYDARQSNQSLPDTPPKRKALKKPKRKKTPHVSHEQISFDQDSELDTELPPSRPKRRSKRNKKKEEENMVPYQETIAVEVPDVTVGIVQSADDHEQLMYENEQMQGKEQPEIKLTDPYDEYQAKYDSEDEVFKEESKPAAPPRKHRSLKSLTYSEHDSILGDVDPDREVPFDDTEIYKTEHEYIIPTPDVPPPVKPPRTLSRSSSKSREHEEFREEVEETPVRPTRTRSQSRTRSRAESFTAEEPCVEEICVQDFRDCMGYAVIDKNIRRDPPLPPPRTPPRRKRSVQSTTSDKKFFTVPRPLNNEPPVRPIRNYSTLGPSRPPRRKPTVNMTDEEKENIDITQYIEIDDEPNRDLHSGEVIQKMKDRPLPAPPRPPRKSRPLQDITSHENLTNLDENVDGEQKIEYLEEAEVSTQTEPLPDDFICEEALQEEIRETIISPQESLVTEREAVTQQEPLTREESEPVVIERRLITPTHYTYEETITHGSLVVEPLNGAKILPDSELTRVEKPAERNVPITKEYDDETSEIPEEFTKLKDPEPKPTSLPTEQKPGDQASVQSPAPPSIVERIIERPVLIQPDSSSEVEVLKAQKLQVSDLDVDRLSVNELLASRIIVSEIDSGNIQATEISSRSGALKVGEIELPPGIVQQLFERLQSVVQEQQSSSGPIGSTPAAETSKKEDSEDAGQKKTPFEQVMVESVETLPPQRPPRRTEESHETSAPSVDDQLVEVQTLDIEPMQTSSLNISETEEIQDAEVPEPPVRTDSSIKPTEEEQIQTLSEDAVIDTTESQVPEEIKESTVEPADLPEDIEERSEVPQRPPRQIEELAKIDEPEIISSLSEITKETPQRPPRHAEKIKADEPLTKQISEESTRQEDKEPSTPQVEAKQEKKDESSVDFRPPPQEMQEPEIDDEPPPRPPEPTVHYIPSQPPASFYALRAQKYVEDLEGDIPMAPRRRRHPQKPPISRSSSEDSPAPPPSRRRYRSPEPTIPQLTGQLLQACGSAANNSIKRLIAHITNNILRNADGQQDLHVMMVILLVLIAGLILLGFGSGKTVHYHHWEFFNPPRDM